MAETAYPVNSPDARQAWSRVLAKETLDGCMASKFMGESESSLIQIKKVMQKGDGIKCSFDLVGLLSAPGTIGDEPLEGNEERLSFYRDSVIINQLRHAVRTRGKVSEQGVPWETRRVSKEALVDWGKERWDIWTFNQLCGFTAQRDERFTGLSCARPPTRQCLAACDNEDDLANKPEATFELDMITDMKADLELSEINVRPVKYAGEESFIVFLHPHQVRDLRQSDDWKMAQAQARERSKDNPLFTGALGMWAGVAIYESKYVTRGVSADGTPLNNVRRAVMCGAQSLVGAIQYQSVGGKHRMMDWYEEKFDYANKVGVSTGIFAGIKKAQWRSAYEQCSKECGSDGLGDHGTIVMSTHARSGCAGFERIASEMTPDEFRAAGIAEHFAEDV